MKKRIMTLLLTLPAALLAAQSPTVTVTTHNADDNSLVFDASVNGYGSYTVRITMRDIEGSTLDAPLTITTATTSDGGEIFSIPAADPSVPVTAAYSYDWLNGIINASPADITYRLPIAAGERITPHTLTPAEAGMPNGNFTSFCVWALETAPNAEIYAMRRGTVIAVEGTENSAGSAAITVEHPDGTQARYAGLRAGSLTVAPGEDVTPETVIGLAGTVMNGSNGIQISVYRYATNRNTVIFPHMMAQTEFINPVFMTSRGTRQLQDGATVKARITKRMLKAE